MKLASKKGKTFADVAKPIQNLIEKLNNKPQSQAVKNSKMLLEKQLDDLFAQQEAMKPQAPQAPQDMNQMIQNPQEEMMEGMPQEESQMGMMQPQMGYGGYLYKHWAGETTGNPNSFNPALDNRTYYRKPIVNPELTDDELGAEQDFRYNRINNRQTVQNRPAGYQDPIVNQMGPMNRPEGYVDPVQPIQTAEPAMNTWGRKNSNINYDKPDFVAKEDAAKTATNTNPYNNWAELGALGTGLAGMYKQMRNNAQVQAPTDVQSVYLGNGIAPPKIDYSEEQNQINADAAADREAVRLGGGSFSTQAGNLGKIRAQQLQGRGKIATQQSRENSANMAAYNDRVANLGAESQKMNLAAAAENNANKVGFQQWRAAQDNAAIANATQMGTNVFNNRTMYKNQLAQAQIMANAHPESVWADAQGNKFYTTPQGQKIPLSPQAEAPVVSATNPTGVNMVPAATPAVVAPITNPTAPATKPKANSKVKTNINSKTATNFVPNGTFSNLPKGMKAFADGGSVYRQELYNKAIGPNVKTIDNAAAMDAEYQQNLNAGNKSFKSSITGLEYKVMPRGEKDLYAANMWKELHGTAPTKPQVAATKKAIENKPTSSVKAKTVAEIISNANNPVAIGVAPVNNFNTTPPGQLPVINTGMYSEDLRKAGTAVTPQGRKTGPSMIDKFQTWQNQPSTYRPSTAAAPDYGNQNTTQYMDQNNMPKFNTPQSNNSTVINNKTIKMNERLNQNYADNASNNYGPAITNANSKLQKEYSKNEIIQYGANKGKPYGFEDGKIRGGMESLITPDNVMMVTGAGSLAKLGAKALKTALTKKATSSAGKLLEGKAAQKLLPGATKTSIEAEDEAFALAFNKRQNALFNSKINNKLKIQEGADKFTKASLKNMNKRLDNMEVDSYGTIKMGENTLNNLQKAELFKIKNLERQMQIAKKAGDIKKYNRLQSSYLNSMEID